MNDHVNDLSTPVRETWTRRLRRVATACGLSLACAAPALAQQTPAQTTTGSVNLQRFEFQPQLRSYALVRDAEHPKKGAIGANVGVHYGWRPFEIADSGDRSRILGIVDHIVGIDIGAAYTPLEWLQIGINLPVFQATTLTEEGKAITGRTETSQTLGIGDLLLAVSFAPVRQRAGMPLDFAIVPRVTFPTGTAANDLGRGAITVGGDLALARRWKPLRIGGHLGYVFQPDTGAKYALYSDDELRYGLALGVPIKQSGWELSAEWAGSAVVVPAGADALGAAYDSLSHTPMELIFAAMYAPAEKPYAVRFGLGPGLTRGYGTPAIRAFAMVTAGLLDPKPADTDKDGIRDPDDSCPEDPEDFDEWLDEDGCPDLDNDEDGVPDTEDACPRIPEDPDGFDDADGCPEPDNDGDGVRDVVDGPEGPNGFGTCMNDAEDLDDFQDEDGCPDDDNDADGIPDALDGHRNADGSIVWSEAYGPGFGDCFDQPEVLNGVDDDDGCPDEALAQFDLVRREITINEAVYFDLGKSSVKRSSYPVLDAVAAILTAYPQITKVEIQGHTDSRGSDSFNKRLSQQRVDSVRTWLVKAGIEADRLTSVGYGEEQPVVPDAKTEEEHAKNRRVAFVVTEQEAIYIEIPAGTEAPSDTTPVEDAGVD